MSLNYYKHFNQENLSLIIIYSKFIKLWFSWSRWKWKFLFPRMSEFWNYFEELEYIPAWLKKRAYSSVFRTIPRIILSDDSCILISTWMGLCLAKLLLYSEKFCPKCPPPSFFCRETRDKKHTLIRDRSSKLLKQDLFF